MSTDELLDLMSTLLFFNGKWYARARGGGAFGVGATAVEAMRCALDLLDGGSDELPNEDLF